MVSTFAGTRTGIPPGRYADGPASTAKFNTPSGMVVDADDNIYVADSGSHVIRRITQAGAVTTFAGTPGVAGNADGNATVASFSAPSGVALTADGSLYVADSGNHCLRRISPSGEVTTVAGSGSRFDSGESDGVGRAARFSNPTGIVIGSDENIYVSDTGNSTIRKVTAEGSVSTFAGTPW